MTKKKQITDDRVAEILGASRITPMEGLPSQGPLDLLGLRELVRQRLQSSGGRPTDPGWTITRSIRFRPSHWRQLELLSREISDASRKVGPGQLAALLLDQALTVLSSRLKAARK